MKRYKKGFTMKSAALTSAAVALVATLAVPFAAQAQGIIGGAQQGAYQGSAAVGSVAGPIGSVVGGVVGGAVGAGVGAGVGAVHGAVILSSSVVQGTAGAVGAIVGAPTTTVIEARPVRHRRH